MDEPILQDEGSALDCTGTRFLHADHQGSIIATANCSGTRLNVNTYDEYGVPAAGNANWGRFQYTGQAWIPDLGMYYYKARIYSPMLGRFMQTDPIGYDDQINLYAYVANDPVNKTDPSGMEEKDIVVVGFRPTILYWIVPGTAENTAWARSMAIATERVAVKIQDFLGGLFRSDVDITDPDSLEGATPEEIEEAAKEAGYTDKQPTTGEGGVRLVRPNSGGRQIRIMPGNPSDPNPIKRGPYVWIPIDSTSGTRNSKPIPLKGNGNR